MKFNIKKFIIILACITVSCFITSALILYLTGGITALSVNSSNIIESKEFLFQDIDNIIIKTVNTKVNVIPVTIAEKKVRVEFYGNISTNLNAIKPKLAANLEGRNLTIEIYNPKTINFGLVNLERLNLDVYVPSNFANNIKVDTVSGQIDIKNFTLSGLQLKSISGEVNCQEINAGKIKIDSTSGKVFLRNVEGEIKINTVSGEISLDMAILNGNININTISGKTIVNLQEDLQFLFNLKTVSGEIKNEFQSEISYADKNSVQGSVKNSENKKLYEIFIKTTSGDITILKSKI